jgi:nicotinamidase-related amidase
MIQPKIISIDFQKDFTAKGGICYKPRPSVEFVKNTLVPSLIRNKIKIAEIISDYRQPRPGDRGNCCRPGEWGYQSEIEENAKVQPVWIKCMNSPIWVRKNGGNAKKKPGLPYQDPEEFTKWLNTVIGKPEKTKEIILIGLTLDCCILSAAQELNWRGYDVKVLFEATDPYSGDQEEKNLINKIKYPLFNWADVITWKQFKNKYL